MIRLIALLAFSLVCFGAEIDFYDDFSSPTLNPAWTTAAGQGSYSLSARPGYLRYSLGGSTHPNGDLAALKIFRPFEGEHWTLDVGMDYLLGPGNGRQLVVKVFFDAVPGADDYVGWYRTKDDYGGGPASGHDAAIAIENNLLTGSGSAFPLLPETHFLRIIRDGQDVSVLRSVDGLSWDQFLQRTFAVGLGNQQVLQFSGWSWAGGQQGMAEYDFVRLTAQTEVPEPGTGALAMTGIAGALWMAGRQRRRHSERR